MVLFILLQYKWILSPTFPVYSLETAKIFRHTLMVLFGTSHKQWDTSFSPTNSDWYHKPTLWYIGCHYSVSPYLYLKAWAFFQYITHISLEIKSAVLSTKRSEEHFRREEWGTNWNSSVLSLIYTTVGDFANVHRKQVWEYSQQSFPEIILWQSTWRC